MRCKCQCSQPTPVARDTFCFVLLSPGFEGLVRLCLCVCVGGPLRGRSQSWSWS